jgi:hypothetical protein
MRQIGCFLLLRTNLHEFRAEVRLLDIDNNCRNGNWQIPKVIRSPSGKPMITCEQ